MNGPPSAVISWTRTDTATTIPDCTADRPRSCRITGIQPNTQYASDDCSPMYSVTCHAIGRLHRATRSMRAAAPAGCGWRMCGHQPAKASRAGSAQNASAGCQPPSSADSGALAPAATAAPRHSAMV